jgi:hypothetical protein
MLPRRRFAMALNIHSHMIRHTVMSSEYDRTCFLHFLTPICRYVNGSVATTNGYTTATNSSVTISVDTTNTWPSGGPGRPAVRLISDNTYTHGLFILDLNHMPYGCGTWPAFWLLGPDWPANGEIGRCNSKAAYSIANKVQISSRVCTPA